MAVKKFRKKIIAGNWKMNKSLAEAQDLASSVRRDLAEMREVDVVICPPFTSLKTVGDVLANTFIKLGAQNLHWESDGAYTGEISVNMLRDLYCHYVIVGHSERRALFHETDEIVNQKLQAALAGNLIPIMCVGETIEQRESGETRSVVKRQLERGLEGVSNITGDVVIAYEPVWAIGTGHTATPGQAQEVHAYIRQLLGSLLGQELAASIRLQYGGSVKPENAAELFSQRDIDGGLIGGAALDARSFVEIVRTAMPESTGKARG